MAKRPLRSNAQDKITPRSKRPKLTPAPNIVQLVILANEADHESARKENIAYQDAEVKEEVKEEEEDEYDIEKIRLKNIEENEAFLQELGLSKEMLAFPQPRSRPSTNGLKGKRGKESLPARKSLRLQRIDPSGSRLPEPAVAALNDENDNPRLPEGPLSMTDHVNLEFKDHEKACQYFHNKVLTMKNMTKSKTSKDLQRFLKSLDDMEITEDRVAKVVPQRIFSVAVHPDQDCVLAVAGDKWGRIGFWDVGSTNGEGGVICYRPHCRPVSCLGFHANNPTRVYSCSYDGTLRCGDFEKAVFDDVYATKEEDDERLNSFAFTTEDSILVANSYGEVAQIDCRSNPNGAENLWKVDDRTLKCVSVHPTENHYFVTASNSGAVKVFDLRSMAKKPKALVEFTHGKSVDSAYFSPLTGKYVLTTAMDNRIRLFDSSCIKQNMNGKCVASASHDNHTGRWLSNFKAAWHPQREDVFIVGSMARPRRIELLDESCKIVKTFGDDMENLASVCSLNAFHPTRNALVGGNSSGRLHIFMD